MLTASQVKSAKPGRYGDGRGGFGLSLMVLPAADGRMARTWAQRLRWEGKPFNLGLGSFPVVTLAKAREKALTNARLVADGIDPRIKVSTVAIPKFQEAMEKTIEILRPNWKAGSRTETQMRRLLTDYAIPAIGQQPIDQTTPADVLAFLTPVALEKPATAAKVKVQTAHVFRWAIAQGFRTDNPASQDINAALPKLGTKEHHAALPHNRVGAAVQTIRESDAWEPTKAALEFVILTAARSAEVRGARWEEIDLDAKTWTIPASRMKSGREHRIPMSRAAMAVLETARSYGDGTGLIFRSPRARKIISGSRLNELLRQVKISAVTHGFRSTFRDWCAESNIDRQLAESALAHLIGDATEAAYLRSDLFNLRRDLMEKWGAVVTGAGGC